MQPTDRLLTIREVVSLIRLSKPTIYKLIGLGQFPRQVHLAEHRVIWLESEVRAWIAARAAQRRVS
jgi:prophage regulatory protein